MSLPHDSERRSRVIRNAIILALGALAVYGLFIFTTWQRGAGG